MRTSHRNFTEGRRMLLAKGMVILWLLPVLCCAAQAQQGKGTPAKTSLTGHYEGTAKNKAADVITVTIDLSEKEGALSGTISSSQGNFTITGGSRQGDTVTLEFDAGGTGGTISLRMHEDRLVGTWSAGDDEGPVDVKRVAKEDAPKGKS